MGMDPGNASLFPSVDGGTLWDSFLGEVENSLPGGITDDQTGAAILFAKKLLLDGVSLSAGSLPRLAFKNQSGDIQEVLHYFFSIQPYIRLYNQANQTKLESDLFKVKGLAELRSTISFVRPFADAAQRRQQGAKYLEKIKESSDGETRVVQRGRDTAGTPTDSKSDLVDGRVVESEWTVVVPKSHDSACFWGKDTKWCTSTPENSVNFDTYSSKGDLYVFINHRTGSRYQFHYDAAQFMDVHDKPVKDLDLLDGLHALLKNKDNIPHSAPYLEVQKKTLGKATPIGKEDSHGIIHSVQVGDGISPTAYNQSTGELIWTKDGHKHRDGGPASVTSTSIEYWKNGIQTREDGPFVIDFSKYNSIVRLHFEDRLVMEDDYIISLLPAPGRVIEIGDDVVIENGGVIAFSPDGEIYYGFKASDEDEKEGLLAATILVTRAQRAILLPIKKKLQAEINKYHAEAIAISDAEIERWKDLAKAEAAAKTKKASAEIRLVLC